MKKFPLSQFVNSGSLPHMSEENMEFHVKRKENDPFFLLLKIVISRSKMDFKNNKGIYGYSVVLMVLLSKNK